jgi:RNA polymerase subunit RPABC4/transcription elongation factor Spt4|tara:strand:+ start:181 stop:354 length:174 start_codon:yes stop_codon:yes gene_type:complete
MLYEPICEICGSHIEDDKCEVCEHTGDNGNWVEKVIKEQAEDPRHDQSPFKDKKNDK